MIESPIAISVVRNLRDESFQKHAASRKYPTYREMYDYDEHLPTFNGGKPSEIIAELAQKEGGANVLDIGCGMGNFFACFDQNAGINAFGLTGFDYRGEDQLSDSIDYRVGDAHKISSIFKGITFDAIVSLHAFEYFADPLGALKQAYRMLNKNGVMFLDKFLPMTTTQAHILQEIWKKEKINSELPRWIPASIGESVSRYSLSIQRGPNPRLPLPFRYSTPTTIDTSFIDKEEGATETRLTYAFDEKMARQFLSPNK